MQVTSARRIRGAAVTATTLAVLLVAGEAAVRVVDGFALTEVRLRATAPRADQATSRPRDTTDDRYLNTIPRAEGVDPAWYGIDPPPREAPPLTADIAARAGKYAKTDPIGAFFAWNPVYLDSQLCAGATFGSLGILDDFYVFDPPAQNSYPTYRHLRNIHPPGWFVSNNFGWRGPDVALNKPAGTIRIAFVGSSMTIDPYGAPFSHIEYIGNWLNRWVTARGWPIRVEVINAARTGIDMQSSAAIIEQELAPLEPDLVVFDGANNFDPRLQFTIPPDLTPAPVASAWPAERASALVRRFHVVARRAERGEEPRKPALPMRWPEGVDAQRPDLKARSLPMDMHLSVGTLDQMRRAVEPWGGALALSSTIGLVHDGLQLHLPRDQGVYDSLNRLYYPLTYAQVRLLLDFQNRVYETYASEHGLPFADKAPLFPADPELFADMFHMTPPGLRLKAWIYFQWLANWIQPAVGSGALPHPMQHRADRHPNFPDGQYPLLSRSAILAACKH